MEKQLKSALIYDYLILNEIKFNMIYISRETEDLKKRSKLSLSDIFSISTYKRDQKDLRYM